MGCEFISKGIVDSVIDYHRRERRILNSAAPMIGAIISVLEQIAACPITIRMDSLNLWSPATVLVFHTEHGDFRWRMPENPTIEHLASAALWFKSCQQ